MPVRRLVALSFAIALSLLPSALHAQQASSRQQVTGEQLLEVLAGVKAWTQATVELREAIKTLELTEFVRRADALRSNFDPAMVLMATTEPPAALKQAAVLLLMATKGVELALWHYIYGGISGQAASYDHGDVLLRTAVAQLTGAQTLFAKQAP